MSVDRQVRFRNLVKHLVQVERFFASRQLGQTPPEDEPESSGLAQLLQMHNDANRKFEAFLKASDDEKLDSTQMLGSRKVSNRKILAQAASQEI